jgi:hypothetical protein
MHFSPCGGVFDVCTAFWADLSQDRPPTAMRSHRLVHNDAEPTYARSLGFCDVD